MIDVSGMRRLLLALGALAVASAFHTPGGVAGRRTLAKTAPRLPAAPRRADSPAPKPRESPRLLARPGPGEECAVEEDDELSIPELLERYGVVALLFHFSVWASCLATGFAALSVVDAAAVVESLPDALRDRLPEDVAQGAGAASGGLLVVKAQLTARQWGAFCELENALNAQLKKLPFVKSEEAAERR
ncbi:hypothetical protein JL721_4918 [Aureococcus anophagefferens]|nr:hypothetical protein JL721_4918 [Aureococcus anophagefferens]